MPLFDAPYLGPPPWAEALDLQSVLSHARAHLNDETPLKRLERDIAQVQVGSCDLRYAAMNDDELRQCALREGDTGLGDTNRHWAQDPMRIFVCQKHCFQSEPFRGDWTKPTADFKMSFCAGCLDKSPLFSASTLSH